MPYHRRLPDTLAGGSKPAQALDRREFQDVRGRECNLWRQDGYKIGICERIRAAKQDFKEPLC
jgi:hypothetical protein